jgi:hypothetical protein
MKATEFTGDLKVFLGRYEYQPTLTERLDRLGDEDFTQRSIDEIVLWKVNRYVAAQAELLAKLNGLKSLSNGEHRQGEEVLGMLLQTHGVDLPMASTLLRFRNPTVFQIIDKHAYRAVFGRDYPLYTSTPASCKIAVYFDYLDKLIELCQAKELELTKKSTVNSDEQVIQRGPNTRLQPTRSAVAPRAAEPQR